MHRHDACWGAHLRLRLLAGLEAGAAQVLEAEVVWHIYQDLQLLRRPVLGYVVPVMPSCASLFGMISATSELNCSLRMSSPFRKLAEAQPLLLAVHLWHNSWPAAISGVQTVSCAILCCATQ